MSGIYPRTMSDEDFGKHSDEGLNEHDKQKQIFAQEIEDGDALMHCQSMPFTPDINIHSEDQDCDFGLLVAQEQRRSILKPSSIMQLDDNIILENCSESGSESSD